MFVIIKKGGREVNMAKGLGYVQKSKLNKKKNKSHKLNLPYGKFIWLIYPVILIFFTQILSHASLIPALVFPFSGFFSFLITLILVFWLGAILHILFENKWIGLNILNVFIFIIALGSRITIYNTDTGLALNNIGIFNELKLLENTPGSVYLIFFISAIIFLILLNLLIYFMPGWSLGIKYKLPIVLGGFLLFLVFSQGIAPKITNPGNKGFNVQAQGVLLFFNNGIFQNNFIQYPSQKEVLNIREDLSFEEKTTEIKPNIIFVKLPNFIDITEMAKLENDPLSSYHNIFNEGVNLYTDISIREQNSLNLEFEILTGLPDDWYPYEVQVRGDNLPDATISIARILKVNGYYTASILPESSEEVKRERFYEKLGFEEAIFKEDLNDGNPDAMLEKISSTIAENKESHLFINTSLNILQPEYENMDNYLNDLRTLDGYIAKLKDIIAANTTPTVMVLYSGQLPTLGKDNSIYKDLGYIKNETNIELLRKVNRGYALIWNNYNKESNINDGTILDLSQLSSRVFNYIGIAMPDYFHFFNNLSIEDGVEGFNINYLAKKGILYSKKTATYKDYIERINIVVKDILGPNKYFETNKNKWLKDR